ncbi:hypothetical protein DL767_011338 [Monosporascus sp. MG133]|nr:hypothetical protein DL767_011338 [Monosporascus sp. MG133]
MSRSAPRTVPDTGTALPPPPAPALAHVRPADSIREHSGPLIVRSGKKRHITVMGAIIDERDPPHAPPPELAPAPAPTQATGMPTVPHEEAVPTDMGEVPTQAHETDGSERPKREVGQAFYETQKNHRGPITYSITADALRGIFPLAIALYAVSGVGARGPLPPELGRGQPALQGPDRSPVLPWQRQASALGDRPLVHRLEVKGAPPVTLKSGARSIKGKVPDDSYRFTYHVGDKTDELKIQAEEADVLTGSEHLHPSYQQYPSSHKSPSYHQNISYRLERRYTGVVEEASEAEDELEEGETTEAIGSPTARALLRAAPDPAYDEEAVEMNDVPAPLR